MQWFTLIAQLFDYVIKALVNYKDTPEGAKEWADFVNAYETAVQVDLNGDGVLAQTRTAPRQPNTTSPTAENSVFRRQSKVPSKTFVNTNADANTNGDTAEE